MTTNVTWVKQKRLADVLASKTVVMTTIFTWEE